MNRDKLKIAFWGSVLCMLLMSLSFLFMPYASDRALEGDALPLRISGVWFWASLIAGYGLFLFADRGRKRLTVKRKKNKRPESASGKRPGMLRVFSNRWARAADIACAVSVCCFIVSALTDPRGYAEYIFLSAAVFAVQMHGVLNGKNFSFFAQIETDGKTDGGKERRK
ncbi:MAG: hypothetical protein LBK23_00200 [Oscillospiraceae bacterium]|jgi:hypothetical protein|nr:hypothetical protein [Oscillospiraceae bacterium]